MSKRWVVGTTLVLLALAPITIGPDTAAAQADDTPPEQTENDKDNEDYDEYYEEGEEEGLPPGEDGKHETTDDGINVPEEIQITATKRSQSLQDVPISVTALSNEMLSDRGITEFQNLQQFVPNLAILPVTDTRSTSIRIRGIGSVGSNAGIDPSVGVFIDGVYQGRAGMSVGDLLDVDQIEVLRGPQGTLYGKNTAAGAITITTKRPSYEQELFAEVVVGDYNLAEIRGSINFPIVEDKVAARIAGFKVGRDGFAINQYTCTVEDNPATPEDEQNRDTCDNVNNANKWGVRAKVVYDVTDSFALMLSGDYSQEDTRSFVADIKSYVHPINGEWGSPPGIFTIFPELADARFLNDPSDPLGTLPEPDPYDLKVAANTTPRNIVSVAGVSLDATLEMDNHRLRWLNAWRTYTSDSDLDGDFSAYNAVLQFTDVELNQASSELTLTSQLEGRLEYQAGLFIFYSEMNTVDTLAVLDEWFPPLGSQSNTNDNRHETFSVAGYGEANYMLVEDLLNLVGGLRLTYEEKSRVGTSVSTVPGLDAPPIFGPFQLRDGERTVSNLQGKAVLQVYPFGRSSFDFFDTFMSYFSFSNGFKSGGFNQVRTGVGAIDEFNDESSLNYELGFRTSSFDNRLTFNITGFFTDYDEFQAQTFSGSSIDVKNAGQLYSYGIESDITYLPPVDNLVLGAQIGWNITEYQKFDEAENSIARFYGCFDRFEPKPLPPPVFTAAAAKCAPQDLAGRRLDGAPRLTATLFAQYAHGIGWRDIEAFGRGDYTYTSMVYLAQDLDSNLLQGPTHLVNLRGGFRAADKRWEATLWVRNVADQRWFVTGFDVPVLSGYGVVMAPPRQVGFTIRINL